MTTMAEETLYERLGGAPAVDSAVDGFYARVVADEELAPYFARIDLAQLKAHQRAFLTMALGGPVRYGGRAMDKAHDGLHITADAFGRVVAHLADTLRALHVDPATIDIVLGALAPLEPQIVTSTAAALASNRCHVRSGQQGRCPCRRTSC